MYGSPRASSMVYICPDPAKARSPRPVTLLFDQWDNVSELFIVGVIASDFPVQATRALRCDNFQSEVPSSCRMASESMGDLGAISRDAGVVEVSF